MKSERVLNQAGLANLPLMPSWITSTRAQTPEDAAFLSGAALSHLHVALTHDDVPQGLLRARLTLRAAEACVAMSGRFERAEQLRDAVHFLRPGDHPGPAGEVYQTWRRTLERPVSLNAMRRALPNHPPDQIARWLEGGRGMPVARAAMVLEKVLSDMPQGETAALILGDWALAKAMGWSHMVPLLAAGLTPRDLRKNGADLRLACHRAAVSSAAEAVRMAADLSRRVARLAAVSPKLRSKMAGQAIEVFLTNDAVTPLMLPLPDRSARRLCDRLVTLDAVRELTGRGTFRLFGV